ncbi:sigma factor G inhibitor Gin [Alteribacillus sp. YIM 98480]|uniref:sigma factor G inhibitor Gin n=1 Tax=Alteribacillus sp. YIM 98480 TaxID=2606599 RepID=UPI00131BEF4D|nr:sigma factor G inhibitor Gin [Alteribacillus sp. YIM 98480]
MLTLKKKDKSWREACILCEREKQNGIHILDSFLCKECEREIIHLEPEHPAYEEKVKKLRKLKGQTLLS